ncbi:protein involved in gliding motility EpsB [Mangrovibacterium diazotrophicum]|uniref:non-specific protein-tyrosine kinase n=2 Tax=Mangrovibacterium diazotrophicum TaxID=1261403 RepID=A0A419VW66_9BACT|nr:protein involved in gliding motility EpsB [Mangrovibacterium diazotrophicum]
MLLDEDDKSFNFKEFLTKLMHYWYWFVILVIIGVGAAFVYNKFTPPVYQVTSKLLVKDNNNNGASLGGIFDSYSMKSNMVLANHIGILTSYNLNLEVIERLGWYVSWYQKMPLGDYSLYGKEPFHVAFSPEDSNLKNVPVYISQINDSTYTAKVDAVVNIGGDDFEINFESKGKYGEKFENNYFSFVVNPSGTIGKDAYYFIFNDLNKLALGYVKKLDVTAVDDDANLLNVMINGDNTQKEIDFINMLSTVYMQYTLKEQNQISENTIDFIDRQLSAVVDTLKTTNDQFTSYRSNKGVYDLSQKAEIIMQKLNELDSRQSMAEMQLSYYENLKKYMEDGEKMQNVTFPSVVGITDSGLNNLVAKLSELYSKKEALSYSLQAKNPSLVVIDRELEYTRKSLQENLNNLVFNTQRELDALNREIYQVKSQLSDVPKTEQDLVNIKRMVDLNNELYNFLLQRRAEAQITKASNLPEIEVLDPAQSATVSQIGPKSTINLALGFLLGIFIPLFVIIAVDYFDDSIYSKEQLAQLTSLPIVADIIHNKFKDAIPVIKYTRSVIAESFRKLRTNLTYMQKGDNKNVIAIHSSVPGEGKTFVAANLASVMALNNRKVVLVGADMRKPTTHQYFNLKNDIGISTYLIGTHKLDEIIKPSGIENLDIVLCGVIPPNPADLLASEEFDGLIEELKSRYDVVVIDNSPFTLVADAAIVGKHAGVNLFVARQGYTHKKMIEVLNYNVEQYGLKKVGIVINDVNPKKYGSYATSYASYAQSSFKSGGYFDDKLEVSKA